MHVLSQSAQCGHFDFILAVHNSKKPTTRYFCPLPTDMNRPGAGQQDPWAQFRSHDWDHIIASEARPEVRAQRQAQREARDREYEALARARQAQRQQVYRREEEVLIMMNMQFRQTLLREQH